MNHRLIFRHDNWFIDVILVTGAIWLKTVQAVNKSLEIVATKVETVVRKVDLILFQSDKCVNHN